MNGIRFENVWKFFESNPVVSDLNLDIRSGEFIVLVGPSGCGKTTSLRMLAGLERPSHGRIYIDDKDVTDVPTGERDISMVFQSYALYPNMNVYRNLAFGPRVRKEPKTTLDERITGVADMLQIRHLLKRAPAALSGGQRQRVALGRALIREPRVFLMDEPLSNLDAALRVQMRAELIRIHQRLEDTTTVYVTHDQVEALTMGDRVAVLKDGVLLQVDGANDLYEYPGSVFVGEFIGSPKMNVLEGMLTVSGGTVSLDVVGVRVDITDHVAGRLADGVSSGPVLVGIRPHDLHPTGAESHESPRIAGKVDISEHTGTEVFATVEVGESHVIARLPRTPIPEPGDRVELVFNVNCVHLFDVESKFSLLARERQRERATAVLETSQ
ncbi:MAG TPA: ABC transporter ATP-binding protein [Acidimicrobiales bacterium]|nr:ABC transporter ATP-binding protein [Acidimicrobiales bacterium]